MVQRRGRPRTVPRRPGRDLPTAAAHVRRRSRHALLSMTTAVQDEVWTAVGDPNRRRLLDLLLATGDSTPTKLANQLPLSRQAVSKHLAVLERAGLVKQHTPRTTNDLPHPRRRTRPGHPKHGRSRSTLGPTTATHQGHCRDHRERLSMTPPTGSRNPVSSSPVHENLSWNPLLIRDWTRRFHPSTPSSSTSGCPTASSTPSTQGTSPGGRRRRIRDDRHELVERRLRDGRAERPRGRSAHHRWILSFRGRAGNERSPPAQQVVTDPRAARAELRPTCPIRLSPATRSRRER